MTTQEFKSAFALANGPAELLGEDLAPFDGFGLPEFQPVTVTIRQVARLIRWQAQYIGGGWDSTALDEIRSCGRRRFVIAG